MRDMAETAIDCFLMPRSFGTLFGFAKNRVSELPTGVQTGDGNLEGG